MAHPLLRQIVTVEFPKELRASAAPAVAGSMRPCLHGDCDGTQVCVEIPCINRLEWRCGACGCREAD